MIGKHLSEKYDRLLETLHSLGRAAVAFSGGVDSALLLYAAKEALGENVIALTASSCLFPERESDEAAAFCAEYGAEQIVIPVNLLAVEGLAVNPPERCYICKKDLFGRLIRKAKSRGFEQLVEGSNTDDTGDYRPGRRAVQELGVRSPLLESGLSKADIRALSGHFGLSTKSKPSLACLASRIPYNEPITERKLGMIDAAEQLLFDAGFTQLRVRIHGEGAGCIARIELLQEDFERFLQVDFRSGIYTKMKELGFAYAALDLKGYRTGSMN